MYFVNNAEKIQVFRFLTKVLVRYLRCTITKFAVGSEPGREILMTVSEKHFDLIQFFNK